MASKARKAFDQSCEDIDRLLEIHTDLGGSSPGRRHGLGVLNKSAIVLITALWEAYCEDIAAEGLSHLVSNAGDWTAIPVPLQKRVAKELRSKDHELAIWDLADSGWRQVLTGRLLSLTEERNRKLNTPKTEQINQLFEQALGVPKMSSAWYWPGMSSTQASAKLDRFVTLRGAIAHRGAATSVRKTRVVDYYAHVKQLVSKTGGRVNSTVKKATGSGFL